MTNFFCVIIIVVLCFVSIKICISIFLFFRYQEHIILYFDNIIKQIKSSGLFWLSIQKQEKICLKRNMSDYVCFVSILHKLKTFIQWKINYELLFSNTLIIISHEFNQSLNIVIDSWSFESFGNTSFVFDF
jgi:hypothetical protein